MPTKPTPPERQHPGRPHPEDAGLRADPVVAEPARDELAARVEALEGELAEARDRYLRLAAEFDNFRKRVRKEQLDTIQYASAGLIEALLPALDDFRRGLDHAPAGADEDWLKGVQLAVQKLEDVLAAQGVSGIDAVGEPFDPTLHEAVASEESTEAPEDTVLAELRRGYRLHDRVLRPAMVKVARRPVHTAEP